MRVETFNYQLAGMRKPDNFIGEDGSYLVQGDRTIARVNLEVCNQ